MSVLPSLTSDMLCSVREKLVLLEPVELKDNKDPVERPVLLDLLDLLEHRFVCHYCHFDSVINQYCYSTRTVSLCFVYKVLVYTE